MDAFFDQRHLELIVLASARIVAFLVVAPPFSHAAIPMRVRGMLGIGLALAMSMRLSDAVVPSETAAFLGVLVLEILHGLLLGFLVSLVFSAVQSAGGLIDLFAGFQLSQAYDPQMQINGAQFTRLLNMVAIVLLFATDGYQIVLGGLARSFTAMPIGSLLDVGTAGSAIIDSAAQAFLAAIQIAGPLLVVLVLADVGLGLLTRVSPALNALQLGYPLKIMIAVGFAGTIFVALPRIVAALGDQAVGLVIGVHP